MKFHARAALDATARPRRIDASDAVGQSFRAEVRRLAEEWAARIDQLETTRDEILRSHDESAVLIRLMLADLDRRVTVLEQRCRDSE